MSCFVVLFCDGLALLVGGDGFCLLLEDGRWAYRSVFYLEPSLSLVFRQIFVEEVFLLLEDALYVAFLQSLLLLLWTVLA